jgi:POT family proton-dependent oligopeptide transporter
MTRVTRGDCALPAGTQTGTVAAFQIRDFDLTSAPLTAAADATSDARARHDRAFFGHPAGLGWLAFCELWERFSYYGMQALLVLYLSNYLFLPENIGNVAGMDALRAFIERATGPRSPQQLASVVFGLYAGLVYLTPCSAGCWPTGCWAAPRPS